MATSTPSRSRAGGHGSSHLDPPTSSQPSSESPVEMANLDASTRSDGGAGSQDLNDAAILTTSPLTSHSPLSTNGDDGDGDGQTRPADSTDHARPAETSTDPTSSSRKQPAAAALTTTTSAGTPIDTGDAGPVLVITLLLTSGARHPYKIDEKYLAKRNVNVPGTTAGGKKDPYSISVYTLKELILREWREEWEAQPSSPSSIRLIYFGRLLDDKTALKECKFNADAANVVHMTVRPQDMIDEEDASKGKSLAREREAGESNAGCRCVIL